MKYRITGILLLLIVFTVVAFTFFSKSGSPEVKVILRYDDYSNRSSLEVENEFLNAISSYDISCSFGIIPFDVNKTGGSKDIPLDSSKIHLIAQQVREGNIEIALHGYSHTSAGSTEGKTEFEGLSQSEQMQKISAARNLLETSFDVPVNTFIPPWNSYDHHTLSVLSDLNFRHISADNFGVSGPSTKLTYLPATAIIPDVESQLKAHFLALKDNRAVFVLMMHDYDFEEVDPKQAVTNIEAFRSFVDEAAGKGWEILSIRDAIEEMGPFDDQTYRSNKTKKVLLNHLSPLTGIVPGGDRIEDLNYYYLESAQVSKLLLLSIFYYLALLLFVWELVLKGLHLVKMRSGLSLPAVLCLIVLLIFALFYLKSGDPAFGKYEMLALVFISGSLLGALLYYLQSRTPVFRKRHPF